MRNATNFMNACSFDINENKHSTDVIYNQSPLGFYKQLFL